MPHLLTFIASFLTYIVYNDAADILVEVGSGSSLTFNPKILSIRSGDRVSIYWFLLNI